MLNKLKKSKSEGFTIIEVMIVLAIAALILLIVFLAVPALQRNSRNTQRKSDAANISSIVSTYEGNNNGVLPVGIGNGVAGDVDMCSAGGTANGKLAAACTANTNHESTKIGYYTQASIWINNTATAAAPVTAGVVATGAESTTKVSTQSVLIVLNEECGSAGTGQYNSRSAAVFYVTESSTGNGSLQCVSG